MLWKKGWKSLTLILPLPESHSVSFPPSCGTKGCFFKQMRYPRLLTLCIDMFHITPCACACVFLSSESNVMPPVSAAEKSIRTQPLHLRKPMMGWLATQVCVCVLMNVYGRLLVDICTCSSPLQHCGDNKKIHCFSYKICSPTL